MKQEKSGLKNAVSSQQKLLAKSSMGGVASSLSGSKTLTGEQLKTNSKEINDMSNALFTFMYTNWQPRDVWEIANDPSKYVIAISDMITTQFHVLGYKTRSGKIGEIYFQKWDALEPPMDKDQISGANTRNSKNEKNSKNVEKRRATRRQRSDKGYATQKQNAEIIAFYFVRVFQILGAMLLVVKDINIPDYDKNTGKTIKSSISNNGSRMFAQQSHQIVSAFRPPTFKGGARAMFNQATALGPFDFLRYYLRDISNEDINQFSKKGIKLDSKKEYMFEDNDIMLFEFTPAINANEISANIAGKQRIGFGFKSKDGYEKRYITIVVKKIVFDSENGEVDRLPDYKAPSAREEGKRKDAYPLRITIEYDVRGKKSNVEITRVTQLSSDLKNGVEYQFSSDDNRIIDVLKAQGLNPRKNFVKMLYNISMFYLKQENPSLEAIVFDTKKDISDNDNSKGSKVKPPKNKSLETTFTELTRKEYQPHCIARALQLLDPASINNFTTGSAVSNICKYAVGDKQSMKLSEYVPTRSVGQLFGKINPLEYKASIEVLKAFVQKESSGDPLSVDGVSNTPDEKEDLQNAIKRLSTAFGMDKGQKSLGEIEVQISSTCNSEKGKEISIDRSSQKFRNMKSSSQQLLAFHLKQVIEISKFLKNIFNISQRPDGSWKVEGPKTELLFAGFETMNALTDQARTLLINYYSGCEEIYQKGLKSWEEEVKGSLPVAPVVASAPPASAPPATAPPATAVPAIPATGGRR